MKFLRAMEGAGISLQGMRKGKQRTEPQEAAELRLRRERAWPDQLTPPKKLLTTPLLLSPLLCLLATLGAWTWQTMRLRKHETRLSSPPAHQNCIRYPKPTSLFFKCSVLPSSLHSLQPDCLLLNAPHFFAVSFSFICNLLLRLFPHSYVDMKTA